MSFWEAPPRKNGRRERGKRQETGTPSGRVRFCNFSTRNRGGKQEQLQHRRADGIYRKRRNRVPPLERFPNFLPRPRFSHPSIVFLRVIGTIHRPIPEASCLFWSELHAATLSLSLSLSLSKLFLFFFEVPFFLSDILFYGGRIPSCGKQRWLLRFGSGKVGPFSPSFGYWMAASANPSGNQDAAHAPSSYQGAGGEGAGGNPANGGPSAPLPDNSASAQALKHNPGLAVEWTPEEQSILEEGLTKYASESSMVRYAKIAMQLREKTVRDVALRCRWMTKKESGKRRKDDHNLSKKNNKKVVSDSSAKTSTHLAARPSVPPYPLPVLSIDNDDEVPSIGGATGQLLEQNVQHFSQISSNLASYQIQENINLFWQIRENIFTILDDMNEIPGIMKQMPPLPVKLNDELANSILPHRTPTPMQS